MFNLKFIFTTLIVIISLLILAFNPKMPKQAVITDSEYGFVEIEVPQNNTELNNQNIEFAPSKTENQSVKIKQNGFDNNGVKFSQPSVKTNSTKSTSKTKTEPSKQTTATKQLPAQSSSQPQKTTQSEKTKTVDIKPAQNIEDKKTKQFLTEEEEIIAWNQWHSRLQNQVMMDAKVVAPLGTVFKFSFTVDKYGNMSNVRVWSTNPSYSNYAVRMIKPVLMSYRNKPILNFPARTRRVINNFEGGFTMARRTQYSSPSDFHDFETVRK